MAWPFTPMKKVSAGVGARVGDKDGDADVGYDVGVLVARRYKTTVNEGAYVACHSKSVK